MDTIHPKWQIKMKIAITFILLFVLVSAGKAQVNDHLQKAELYSEKIGSYRVHYPPEILQGAWIVSEPNQRQYSNFLYFTDRKLYEVQSLDVFSPKRNSLPIEYGERDIHFNEVGDRQWSYLSLGFFSAWIVGEIILVDDSTLKITEGVFTLESVVERPERTRIYRRVTPRPGQYRLEFHFKHNLTPPALVGKWMSLPNHGTTWNMDIEPTPPGTPMEIRYASTSLTAGRPNKTTTLWKNGSVIPWGTNRWWMRTGPGPSDRDLFFVLNEDGELIVTEQPLAENLTDTSQRSEPRVFRRLEQ